MPARFMSSFPQLFDDQGAVLANGSIVFYEPGTAFAVRKDVYKDPEMMVPWPTQTVTLGVDGRPEYGVYLNGNYDIRVYDDAGNELFNQTNISPEAINELVSYGHVYNGGFELGTDGWVVSPSTGASIVTTGALQGAKSLRMLDCSIESQQAIPIASGAGVGSGIDLAVSLVVMAEQNCLLTVQVKWYAADGSTLVSADTLISENLSSGSHAAKFALARPPASARYAKLNISVSGGYALVDAISMVNALYASQLLYDGSTTVKGVIDSINSSISALSASKVSKSGDTMSGYLSVPNPPTQANHAATKDYVDSSIASAASQYVTIATSQQITGNKRFSGGFALEIDNSQNIFPSVVTPVIVRTGGNDVRLPASGHIGQLYIIINVSQSSGCYIQKSGGTNNCFLEKGGIAIAVYTGLGTFYVGTSNGTGTTLL